MNSEEALVLIDSSLWILALKRNCPLPVKQIMGDLLEKDLAATCGLIMMEILQGCRTKREYEELTAEMNALHYLETDRQIWDKSSQLAYSLRREGITIPTVHIFIASLAIEHGLIFFHADHHFEIIAKNSTLKSKQISTGI